MDDRRRVLVTETAEQARRQAAEILASAACDAVSRHGQFTLALSGGTTPRPLYELLASPAQTESIPWQDTQIFFGDERDVPSDHADSNYRMIQDTLLGAVPIRLENVHPMLGDASDLDAVAAQYAEQITRIVPPGEAGVPAFDLILLGMGGDGHVASLFPGCSARCPLRIAFAIRPPAPIMAILIIWMSFHFVRDGVRQTARRVEPCYLGRGDRQGPRRRRRRRGRVARRSRQTDRRQADVRSGRRRGTNDAVQAVIPISSID